MAQQVLNGLPIWLSGASFVIIVGVTSYLGLMFVRRRFNYSALQKHNEVGGVILQIIGTLYAVIIAFVVVIVWQAAGTADDRAAAEADTLGDLIRDAGLLPKAMREELQTKLRNYAQAVVNEEWPGMANGESSQHVSDILSDLYKSFSAIQPSTPREVNIHAQMLRNLDQLSSARRLRILSSKDKVPDLLWGELLLGGLITVIFAFFFGVERARPHALMATALAVMIGLTLFLILELDGPFSGGLRVQPEALRLVLDKYGMPNYTGE